MARLRRTYAYTARSGDPGEEVTGFDAVTPPHCRRVELAQVAPYPIAAADREKLKTAFRKILQANLARSVATTLPCSFWAGTMVTRTSRLLGKESRRAALKKVAAE